MIKRRRLPSTLCAVLVAAVAVGGCSAPAGVHAAGKPYAGTTLRALLANHPWAVAIKPLLPSFEKATGMTVKIESYGEDQLAQKLTVEFTSGSSDIDVFMQRPLQQAKLFARTGWTQDLNASVKDARKTPASYAFRDFERPARMARDGRGTTRLGLACRLTGRLISGGEARACRRLCAAEVAKQARFADVWASNLTVQGFIEAAKTQATGT
jgi:hypothetical protein